MPLHATLPPDFPLWGIGRKRSTTKNMQSAEIIAYFNLVKVGGAKNAF